MELPGIRRARRRRGKSRSQAIDVASSGRNLSPAEVEELEESLRTNPENLLARTKLLGFYFVKQFESKEARLRRSDHIIWIIQHVPDTPIALTPYVRLETDSKAYAKAKSLWLNHLKHPKVRLEVVENAAWFFSTRDEQLARELLGGGEGNEKEGGGGNRIS